ncbi:unnamed protein product [Schistosoma margrebowiei]|uniref:Uncharacterized protein n=1 Tax=Schistosoma margrebowiei TaxID=48269 RepID=A0A183M4F6_9TREM|nr:unnamed protein product [Schistosoma margrebowiei]
MSQLKLDHHGKPGSTQLFTDHENVSQYNQMNDSNYYSNEIFDIHWQLNNIEGNIEELPTIIIKILIPIINESINKQSINSNEYNTLINNSIINDIELINSRQISNYNIKNIMNNMKENEENNCNNEFIYDKMKIIDLSYEQDLNNKIDQQYEMIAPFN